MRRALLLGLKVALTLSLLWLAASKVNLPQLSLAARRLDAVALLIIALLASLQITLSALRWRSVLGYLGEKVPSLPLVGDTLVGTTYNMLLPTTVGGDVIRALRCARRVESSHHAWASVVYERMMGLICLALLPLLGLLAGASRARPLYLGITLGASALFLLALGFAHAPLKLLAEVAKAKAPRVAGLSFRLAGAFEGALSRPRARLETFAWSLACQVVALSILVAAGSSLREPGLLRAAYVGAPLVLIFSMVPITVAGLGLRESLFMAVLPEFGLAREQSGLLALVWLGVNLSCALIGGAILLLAPLAKVNRPS